MDDSADLAKALDHAVQLHTDGKLAEAEASYRKILAVDPNHPEVLHLLGVVALQVGANETAVQLIGQALAIKPDFVAAWNNMGIAHKALGQFDDAINCYHQVLSFDPDHPGALSNLGSAHREKGDVREAVSFYQKSLILQADAEVFTNLGNALEILGDLDGAVANHHRALALNPNYPGALNNLAVALGKQGKTEDAAECFQKSLAINPDAIILTSLGDTQRELGKPLDAEKCYLAALSMNPHLAEAQHNLGVVFQERGELDKAMACYHKALAIRADYAEAHLSLGHCQLLLGDLEAGLQNQAWRWHTKSYRASTRAFDVAKWDGQDFQGKTLFIHREQGLGDFIQFVRYLPLVAKRGGRIIIEAPEKLLPLFPVIEGADGVVTTGRQPASFDFYIPLLDLPQVLGTGLDSIPQAPVAMAVDPERVEKWQKRLAAYQGLRVGLIWGGNPEHQKDHLRSMNPALFKPLPQVAGAHIFSLQVDRDGQASTTFGPDIIDLIPEAAPFNETAAVMMALDLIVTVDSSSAHLAATLGRPVWTLLPFIPDWRWMLDRDDSPWYPTMRLFRQPSFGDWGPVIDNICETMASLKVDH